LGFIDGNTPEDRFYELSFQDERLETYDHRGYLVKQVDSNGNQLAIHNGFGATGYSFKQFTNEYGQHLQLYYTNGLLTRVSDSNNVKYFYEYDEANNLLAVVYPDFTSDTIEDNPRKVYDYEGPDFPNHLIGITDETGDRYATFNYDENGKDISTELSHKGNETGQELVH